jgi:hypothetical protein
MVLERVNDDRTGYGGSSGSSSNEDGNNGGGQYPQSYGEGATDSFLWFRALLFTLLIVSPCFRAGYLWYAAGGRIHIRRNENGRIIGLLYVPPMRLHHQMMSEPSPPIYGRLTEEQVLSLPEILYVKPITMSNSTTDDDPTDDDVVVVVGTINKNIIINNINSTTASRINFTNETSTLNNREEPSLNNKQPSVKALDDDVQIRIGLCDRTEQMISSSSYTGPPEIMHGIQSYPAGDGVVGLVPPRVGVDVPVDLQQHEETPHLVGVENSIASAPKVSPSSKQIAGSDEEQPAVTDDDGSCGIQPSATKITATTIRHLHHTTTMCSTCSICIDEFEEGEKLRLLPRCGHAFHTECILPWLTERQGCCPLCKTSVLEEADNDDDENNNNNNVDVENDVNEGGRELGRVTVIVNNTSTNDNNNQNGINNITVEETIDPNGSPSNRPH